MKRAALLGSVVLVACAACVASAGSTSAPDDGERGTASLPIIGGTQSDASQNAVVLVFHSSATSSNVEVCSGTLLAPRLVLTARHCVATTDAEAACNADGTATTGGVVHADFDPKDMYVFAGVERPATTPIADVSQRGAAIIDDGATTLCNHDMALLLLETPVPNAMIAPVRLDTRPAPDEPVTLVGWGIMDATAKVPAVRQQRTGQTILAVGPSNELGLGSSELEIGEGACEGDSGGPALAAVSGAVIASLSRGGNGTVKPGTAACIQGQNVYTMASGFKDLVLSAYARAGQTPWLEGDPNPLLPKPSVAASTSPGTGGASNGGCSTAGRSGPAELFSTVIAVACALLARSLHPRKKWPQRT
jgi:hypothetical protein